MLAPPLHVQVLYCKFSSPVFGPSAFQKPGPNWETSRKNSASNWSTSSRKLPCRIPWSIPSVQSHLACGPTCSSHHSKNKAWGFSKQNRVARKRSKEINTSINILFVLSYCTTHYIFLYVLITNISVQSVEWQNADKKTMSSLKFHGFWSCSIGDGAFFGNVGSFWYPTNLTGWSCTVGTSFMHLHLVWTLSSQS